MTITKENSSKLEVLAPTIELKEWQVLSNGKAVNKPEWRLHLSNTIGNGVTVLNLSEPSIGAIRRAKKLVVKDEKGEATEDSTFDMGMSLLADVTKLTVEDLDGVKLTDFLKAQNYLGGFVQDFA